MANSRNLHLSPTILFQDTSEFSHDYFNLTELPGFFKLGSNIVKLTPNVNGLQFGTPVDFEFVSSNGTTLVSDVKDDPDNAGQKIIEVFVTEETAAESIIIRLLGTAKFGTYDVSFPQQNNIFWTSTILADPLAVELLGSTSGSIVSGSLFVGNASGDGIQIRGDKSEAYIRSIGYGGLAFGEPGFMMFSGSVLPGNNVDEYSGVGLELFQHTGSFFKFRTSPEKHAGLEIRTDKFLIGSSGSKSEGVSYQFISGSNGQIEISSSTFHLNPADGSFRLGDKLVWDGTTLSIVGNLTISNPSSVGSALGVGDTGGGSISDSFIRTGPNPTLGDSWVTGSKLQFMAISASGKANQGGQDTTPHTQENIATLHHQPGMIFYRGELDGDGEHVFGSDNGFQSSYLHFSQSFQRANTPTLQAEFIVSGNDPSIVFGWIDDVALDNNDTTIDGPEAFQTNLALEESIHMKYSSMFRVESRDFNSTTFNDGQPHEFSGFVSSNTDSDLSEVENESTTNAQQIFTINENQAWPNDGDFSNGTSFIAKITLKHPDSGGGAIYEIYKNGDMTSPFASFETSGTLSPNLRPIIRVFKTSENTFGQDAVLWRFFGVNASPTVSSTSISGDMIKTGKIESTNWTGPTGNKGTSLDLNGGIFHMRSDGSTKFKLDANAGTAQIAGFQIGSTTLTGNGTTSKFQTNDSGKRIEIGGADNNIKFFKEGEDNAVCTIDDNLLSTHPGIEIKEGVIRIINLSDFGDEGLGAPLFVKTEADMGENRCGGFFGISNSGTSVPNWWTSTSAPGITGKVSKTQVQGGTCAIVTENLPFMAGIVAECNITGCQADAIKTITAGIVAIGTNSGGGFSFYGAGGILYNSGEIRSGADIVAFHSSDKRMKENIVTIDEPLNIIGKLRGVTFNWKKETAPEWANDYLDKDMSDMGFIAQEVQDVLPNLVQQRENEYLTVRYEKMIPLLVEGIKSQQKQIDLLTKRITELESK